MLVHIIMGRDIGENFIYIYEFESGGANTRNQNDFSSTEIQDSNSKCYKYCKFEHRIVQLYNNCSMNF